MLVRPLGTMATYPPRSKGIERYHAPVHVQKVASAVQSLPWVQHIIQVDLLFYINKYGYILLGVTCTDLVNVSCWV